jgi:hypothetical protein
MFSQGNRRENEITLAHQRSILKNQKPFLFVPIHIHFLPNI